MSTRHFCTYFDHNYLPRGIVMLESLHEHCPHAQIHVLCLSDQCHAALAALAYPYVSLIRLPHLEAADPELAATQATRSLIEYYFTITPCLPWHLLTRDDTIDEVTYLDADMMFFSSPEPIFEEAPRASVIITPHKFAPHLAALIKFGMYNVSWLTFRRTTEGMACLAWYRKSCLNWCKDELEADRFADQKYLDAFPQRFAGVHVMQHNGGGVAPWNLAAASVTRRGNAVTVNGETLIFYHAQGFKHIRGPFYSSGFRDYSCSLTCEVREGIVCQYARRYSLAVQALKGGRGSFVGIRQDLRSNFAFLRDCKSILREWEQQALVVCWSWRKFRHGQGRLCCR